MSTPQKILICDDHPVCCHGLRSAIEAFESGTHREFYFATTAHQAVDLSLAHRFDFIFMDVMLPDFSGLEAIRRMKSSLGGAKVIVFTAYTDTWTVDSLKRALQDRLLHAAMNKTYALETIAALFTHLRENPEAPYLDETTATLLNKVESVPMTKREMEILLFIVKGLTSKEIAERLGCSHETVRTHRQSILLKAGVRNAAELGAWFSERYGKPDASP
jgi:DNA-binding NarL/FixJ family response regulator